DGDLVAYTMEYADGGDLAARLNETPKLTLKEIFRILSEICGGVQAIHDAGLVHRNLRTENVLLSQDGSVKISDFGIALPASGPKLVEHGGVVGTIDYVSPEYLMHSQYDWRSDIYSIGVIAYEMLTGNTPFKGDSIYAIMVKRLKSDPVPPSTIRQDCP